MCGAMMPSAPPSSTRAIYSGAIAGTRTNGAIPAASAVMQIWLVASSEKLLCSRSTYSVSNPAALARPTISTLRTRRAVIEATTSPRASLSRTELRTIPVMFLSLDRGSLARSGEYALSCRQRQNNRRKQMARKIVLIDSPLNETDIARELVPAGFELVVVRADVPEFMAEVKDAEYLVGFGD